MHDKIETVRRRCKIPAIEILKFNPCPEGVDYKDFIAAKQGILEAAGSCGCEMHTVLIHHSIAQDTQLARRNAINSVLLNFRYLLDREHAHGMVLIDRFDDREIDHHLRDKFSVGLVGLPHCSPLRLKKIIGFHYSAIGQSHFATLVDVALGSFRYAVNAQSLGQGEKLPAAAKLLSLLVPLFRHVNGSIPVTGIQFSPNSVRVPAYREQYASLKQFLWDAGLKCSGLAANTALDKTDVPF